MEAITSTRSETRYTRSDLEILADYGRRKWWVVAGCVAAALLAAIAYLLIARPSYTATAVLIMQPQSDQPNAQQSTPTPELVRSQLEVLDSRAVLDATVRKLKLYNDPEFQGDASASSPLAYRIVQADEVLGTRVDAENDGRSYAISLSVTTHNPDKSARIANAIAATYIDQQRAHKVRLIEATRATLASRLADLRAQTLQAENGADAFRRQHGLVPLSSIPEDSESYAAATPASRQIIELAKENATLAGSAAEASAALTAQQRAIASGRGDSTAEVLASPVVTNLREQEANLAKNEAELLARYQPDHPLVRRTQAELGRVRREIGSEIGRIHTSVTSQARAGGQAFRAADDYMNRLASHRSGEISASTRLTQLQDDAKLKRQVYEEFAGQMERASERAGLQLPDVALVSPASAPSRPSAPHKAFVLIAALLVGLILGLILGIGRSIAGGRTVEIDRVRTSAA